MELDTRKQKLLIEIVEQYIKSAEPVGSRLLVEAGKFDVSPATLRNDMAELEKNEFVYQPHTSAGRMPTEKGYRFYLVNKLKVGKLSDRDRDKIEKHLSLISDHELEPVIKSVAKEVAEMVNGAVIVAFSVNDIYYTGITNIFSQPEFYQPEMIINMSRIIDHLDQVMSEIFEKTDEPNYLLGKDNPFGQDAGVVLTKYKTKDKSGIFGILGPMRMDYQRNFNIINYLRESLQNV